MSYQTCEDCGCRIYNEHCVNCHEETFIAEQYYELGLPMSKEFEDKIAEQAKVSMSDKARKDKNVK